MTDEEIADKLARIEAQKEIDTERTLENIISGR
jgi:hypothetical protein